MNEDFEQFVDDLDESAEFSVHLDEDMVTLVISESDGVAPVQICLNPAHARQAARAITLTSFQAEGEDVTGLEEELAYLDDAEGDDPVEILEGRVAAYLLARELTGPGVTDPDETLDLARFLVGF